VKVFAPEFRELLSVEIGHESVKAGAQFLH